MTDEDRDFILLTVAKYLGTGEPIPSAFGGCYRNLVPNAVAKRLLDIVEKERESKPTTSDTVR